MWLCVSDYYYVHRWGAQTSLPQFSSTPFLSINMLSSAVKPPCLLAKQHRKEIHLPCNLMVKSTVFGASPLMTLSASVAFDKSFYLSASVFISVKWEWCLTEVLNTLVHTCIVISERCIGLPCDMYFTVISWKIVYFYWLKSIVSSWIMVSLIFLGLSLISPWACIVAVYLLKWSHSWFADCCNLNQNQAHMC